jgi:FKBP-type peptidyl-prolyl cis-trans isomerase
MKPKYAPAMAAFTVVTFACGGGGSADMATFADSASYAIGMNMGSSLEQVRGQVNEDLLLRGIRDALSESDAQLTEQEIMRILQKFATDMREAEMASRAGAADRNRSEGDAYRVQNAQQAGVMTTASGLQYEVLTEGVGARPSATDRVTVHYRGTLIDGTVFDSSYDRNEPATFTLDGVIPGWTEGVQLMTVGSKYRFVLPPELAYGPQGAGPDIGPNATLVFEVELLKIGD